MIDDVAGSESEEFVETHLAGCEECKKLYQEMKTDLPAETEKEEVVYLIKEEKYNAADIRTSLELEDYKCQFVVTGEKPQ